MKDKEKKGVSIKVLPKNKCKHNWVVVPSPNLIIKQCTKCTKTKYE